MGVGEHVGTRANDRLGDSAHRHLIRWVNGVLWVGGMGTYGHVCSQWMVTEASTPSPASGAACPKH